MANVARGAHRAQRGPVPLVHGFADGRYRRRLAPASSPGLTSRRRTACTAAAVARRHQSLRTLADGGRPRRTAVDLDMPNDVEARVDPSSAAELAPVLDLRRYRWPAILYEILLPSALRRTAPPVRIVSRRVIRNALIWIARTLPRAISTPCPMNHRRSRGRRAPALRSGGIQPTSASLPNLSSAANRC